MSRIQDNYHNEFKVTKLLLKIVMDRMKRKIETELDDAQSGFRQGRGTREGLLKDIWRYKRCIHLFLRLPGTKKHSIE